MLEIPDEIGYYLKYNSDSGEIIWIRKSSKNSHVHVGSIAGSMNFSGYLQTMFKGVVYQNHRIAWFLFTGEQPTEEIDHIDSNKLNNAFVNLRTATQQENSLNKGLRIDNTSGYKGVHLHTVSGKWIARIAFNGKRISLGYFDTPKEAHLAYCEAADKYHKEFKNYG